MKIDKEIIDKVLDNAASPNEVRAVYDWFATDEGQEHLSQRLLEESKLMGKKEVEEWSRGDIPTERMRTRFLKQIMRPSRQRRWWTVAAVLIPFLLLGTAVTFLAERTGVFSQTQYAEITVPCGERMQVVLPDGSIVELNSATTLRYPTKFGLFNRSVELYGEGYFTVAKEKGRPFTVHTRGLDVRVTGTQFNAKSYAEDTHTFVTLDEGGVLLKAPESKEYPLVPGETAVYDRRSGKCDISRPINREGVDAWRTNSLNFYMVPLREIIKVMERQYDTQFIIRDSTLLESKYTLSTSKVNVADVLHDLEMVSHIIFTKKEANTFEIGRKN